MALEPAQRATDVVAQASFPSLAANRCRALTLEPSLRVPAKAFLIHLLLVETTAALAMALVGTRKRSFSSPPLAAPPSHGLAHYLVQPLANFDGVWYALIASHGYGTNPYAAAFWPIYPLALRVLHSLTGFDMQLAGVLLSNTAFLLALIVLYRLVRLDFDAEVARRAVMLLALFPTAFFFSAVYSESLFLLLSVGALYLGRTGRWHWAAAAAALTALTRAVGLVVLLPLALIFLEQHGWRPSRRWLGGAGLGVAALAPLLFFLRLQLTWGDPLLWVHAQSHWGRYSSMPWQTIGRAFSHLGFSYVSWAAGCLGHPDPAHLRQCWVSLHQHPSPFAGPVAVLGTLVALPLAGFTVLRVRPAYSSYALLCFLIPLCSPARNNPVMSMPRFLVVLFPFFMALAMLLKRPRLYYTVLAVSAALFATLLALFSVVVFVG